MRGKPAGGPADALHSGKRLDLEPGAAETYRRDRRRELGMVRARESGAGLGEGGRR